MAPQGNRGRVGPGRKQGMCVQAGLGGQARAGGEAPAQPNRAGKGVPALQPAARGEKAPPDATRYIIPYRVKGFERKVRKLLGFYGEKNGQNLTVSRNLSKG